MILEARTSWIRWVARGLGVLLSLTCVLAAGRLLWPQPGIDEQPGSTWNQLAFVRDAIDGGADEQAQGLFPEGYFFLNALYGLAWVQAGQSDPEHRAEALRESRWALARLESERGRERFSPTLRPAYGVFWAGWTNLLRGGILALGGVDDADEVRRFTEGSDELGRAFAESATPYLQAYPGQAWPVDSTVAIASLRLHDRLLEPRFDAVITRWLGAVQQRLDPATGLMPHRVKPVDGTLLEGARATSQSVIHRFLPEIDSRFAPAQYDRFRDQFISYPGGFGPAIREYPPGVDGSGDVDSGPLIGGVSLSATVVTMGAARVNGDERLASALGSVGETAGFPVTLPGSKRYAFGLVPIGDAFVVWSSTARRLTGPQAAVRDHELSWWWPVPWLAVISIVATLPWIPRLVAMWRRRGGRSLVRNVTLRP